jgi:hypothetical protein
VYSEFSGFPAFGLVDVVVLHFEVLNRSVVLLVRSVLMFRSFLISWSLDFWRSLSLWILGLFVWRSEVFWFLGIPALSAVRGA